MSARDQNADLRMLSLLHALRDKKEFVREVRQLLKSSTPGETCWRKICDMGRDLAPEDRLFRSAGSWQDQQTGVGGVEPERDEEIGQGQRMSHDRRLGDRRAKQRRSPEDRRSGERRTVELPWLGKQRRTGVRRQHARRHTDRRAAAQMD